VQVPNLTFSHTKQITLWTRPGAGQASVVFTYSGCSTGSYSLSTRHWGAVEAPVVYICPGAAQVLKCGHVQKYLGHLWSRQIHMQLRHLWCRHVLEQHMLLWSWHVQVQLDPCDVDLSKCSTGLCSEDMPTRSWEPCIVVMTMSSKGSCCSDTFRGRTSLFGIKTPIILL
jgi:hypothetical protein